MKNLLLEKFKILLVFMFFYLVVEAMTFVWVNYQFLPSHIVIDLVIVFAIGSLIFLFKSSKLSIIYLSLVFLLVNVIFLVNATMFSVYQDMFTLQQLSLVSEATDVVNIDMISFSSIAASVLVCGLYTLTMVFLQKSLKKHPVVVKNYYAKALSSFFVSSLLITGFFMLPIDDIDSFVEDTYVTTFKRAAFQSYGIMGYYTKEIEDMIQPVSDNQLEVVDSVPSDYHALLEGKNVINIMLESVQSFAINSTLTPNLYQLTQEGLYFDNSYSENKTNTSEMISITGNYPSVLLNPYDYEYDFSYSLPSVLSEAGYATAYYHDNVPTFYKRGVLMPQLGFEDTYFHDDLYPGEEMWHWTGDYTLDSETMTRMLDNGFIRTDKPFYSFWATLSTHGPYNYGPENIQKFTDFGYFAAIDQAEADGLWTNILAGGEEEDVLRIRHYQAAVMNLDVAVGMMLDKLADEDLLDDTIIVLYGDHLVYYHNIPEKRFPDFNDYYNMEMYHNFFCIYNPSLTETYLSNTGSESTTISKFVSPYNIYPTLMDLLGFEYNVNLTMADSIFTDTQEVFYSIKLTGFFNNIMYSDNGEDIIYCKDQCSNEEIYEFMKQCALMKERVLYINFFYESTKNSKLE